MVTRFKYALAGSCAAILVVLVIVALVKTQDDLPHLTSFSRRPSRVMGTSCLMTAVVPLDALEVAARGLDNAEAELRRTEALMSAYIADSEISRLNAAESGQFVRLSGQTLEVLRAARLLTQASAGAFDVTCRPLIQAWREAESTGHVPAETTLLTARDRSSWDLIRLMADGAVKSAGSARVDLGGIAKGHAIDRAVGAMVAAGCLGGLVDVGGDTRVFGVPPSGALWQIGLRSPFADSVWVQLAIPEGAVCTSGNYARFVTIDGRRFSHIVDPRTGWPADVVPSATVWAPTARTADGWATALSVLDREGIALLRQDNKRAEAMVVVGAAGASRVLVTEGFDALITDDLVVPTHVLE